jgi:type VI secretion system secreted protein VgrG
MALLGRDTTVTGPSEDVTFLLETFQGKEALGTPYSYSLTLLSEDPNIAVTKVLGQAITVEIKLDTGDFRYFSGIVTYFAKTGLAMRHTRYAVVLNPKLTLLDYTRDCRIFFDHKAPDLASELLPHYGGVIEAGKLQGSYRMREYCVQYRESCFNFLQRLFEEEGIYYFFKHESGKHTMVLADSASAHATVSGYEKVQVLPKERKQARDQEHFWSLNVAGSLYPGKFTSLQGYDYSKLRPKSAQLQNKPSTAPDPGKTYDDYDNPGGLTEKADAEADAQVRLESDLVANTIIEVEGNAMGLGVGDLVTLIRPPAGDKDYNPFWSDDDFDKEYLITSASYSISVNQAETGDVADSDEPYKATFTLLDSQTQFRPRRAAYKPRIEGPQTAQVVGPSGEEIYTDKFGRVKVQFDWDRLGALDQKSSCWVRVSQAWAGKQWGAIHIPRINQEVIVEFLDGDPDRPIITGRVYNADNMPPYGLPDNKTQSGIKSRSSKGGAPSNFNEIRFEDLKGKEELFIQAEKDENINVKNNQSSSIGVDRSLTVGNNETVKIGTNRTETVGSNEKISIGSNRTETVGVDESVKIGANQTLNVGSNQTISVGANQSLTVGAARTKSVGGAETVTIASTSSETIGAARSVTIAAAYQLTVGGAINETVGGAKAEEIGAAKSVNVGAASSESVGGNKTLSAGGNISESAGGNIEIVAKGNLSEKGKVVAIQADDEIALKCGSATLVMKKSGDITINGNKINIKGDGDVVIKGSNVKGN